MPEELSENQVAFTPIEPLVESSLYPKDFDPITTIEADEGSSRKIPVVTQEQLAAIIAAENARLEYAKLWESNARVSGPQHFSGSKIAANRDQPQTDNPVADLLLPFTELSPNLLLTDPQTYIQGMFLHRLEFVRREFQATPDASKLTKAADVRLAVSRTLELLSQMNENQQELFWGIQRCGVQIKTAFYAYLLNHPDFLPTVCSYLTSESDRQLILDRLTRPILSEELAEIAPIGDHVETLRTRILNDIPTQTAVLTNVSLALNSELRPSDEERALTWNRYTEQKEDMVKVAVLSNQGTVEAVRKMVDNALAQLMEDKTELRGFNRGWKIRLFTGVFEEQKILAQIALKLRNVKSLAQLELDTKEQTALAAYLHRKSIPLAQQIVNPKKPFAYKRLDRLGSVENASPLFTKAEYDTFIGQLPVFWRVYLTEQSQISGQLEDFFAQILPDQVGEWQFFVANRQQALQYWQEFEAIVRSKLNRKEQANYSNIDLLELWMSFASVVIKRSKSAQ
ncbi:hypothetical protein KBD71_02870 [Candidatus Woesebacteria bacterium]|nr:hypothetical protein [Candidatus Woesebacteria bacterium]